MQYGVDVAATRLDDLDKMLLSEIAIRRNRGEVVSVLDVGCGKGGLVAALALAGAAVTALDIDDYRDEYVGSKDGLVEWLQADVREWVQSTLQHYDIVVLQRMLHYLPYGDAALVLRCLGQMTNRLYLSVTGVTTAIASHYAAVHEPIKDRFATLDPLGQELFSITAPMCLYSYAELLQVLTETGWQVEWSRVSDFGNIKVVAVKCKK
jgi:SAM-dependent methyltransferase